MCWLRKGILKTWFQEKINKISISVLVMKVSKIYMLSDRDGRMTPHLKINRDYPLAQNFLTRIAKTNNLTASNNMLTQEAKV
jgi:hypothetical protein